MKTFYLPSVLWTKKYAIHFWLVLLLASSVQFAKSQSLNEIPNPDFLTQSSFVGGFDGNLFFEYVDANFYGDVYHYDDNEGTLKAIPFPANTLNSWYLMTINKEFYFLSSDLFFQLNIHIYDGTAIKEINYPSGVTFSEILPFFEEKIYTIGSDLNLDFRLFGYDGTNNVQVNFPAGHTYNTYMATFQGLMYFSLWDENGDHTVFSFNGTTFTKIPSPANASFGIPVYYSPENLWMTFEANGMFEGLYQFKGNTFTKIQNPVGYSFSWDVIPKNETEEEWYISYYHNSTLASSIFLYNGNTLTQLANPAGYNSPYFINANDGTSYFSFTKTADNSVSLFKTTGTNFQKINEPTGTNFSIFLETFSEKNYYVFMNQTFQPVLMKLQDDLQSVAPVALPAGFTFNNYASVTEDKMYFGLKNGSGANTLFMFGGEGFTQVSNPDGKRFNSYQTENYGSLFLRYDDANTGRGTLYKLRFNNLPTSENNTVVTSINHPYNFAPTDFIFNDEDTGDLLTSIKVTEIPIVGSLLLDDVAVTANEIILNSDLSLLTFVPAPGGWGVGYASFKYKVFDGSDFSEQAYTITIDVTNTTATDDRNLLNAKVMLYPVPAQAFLEFQVEANQPIGKMDLNIFSSTGQLLQQRQLTNVGNSLRHSIDVTTLPAGNFVLVGKTEKGNVVKKFAVSR